MALSASEMAQKVGTDARTLRRFLRENDSYSNPGSGGRYSFAEKDVASMKRAFAAWQRSKPSSKSSTQKPAKTSKRASKSETRAQRKSAADKRVDALEASLKASGKHISQHRDS